MLVEGIGCTSFAAVVGLFAAKKVQKQRQLITGPDCKSDLVERRATITAYRRASTVVTNGTLAGAPRSSFAPRSSLASLAGGRLSFHTAVSRLSTGEDADVDALAEEAQELERLHNEELQRARELRGRFAAEAADPVVALFSSLASPSSAAPQAAL